MTFKENYTIDYEDINEVYEEDEFENDYEIDEETLELEKLQKRRLNEMRCPNCGRKLVVYRDWSEHFGTPVYEEYYECPNGCESEDY